MTDKLNDDIRIGLTEYRLERSKETLCEADCLAKNCMYSGAMNRLYYACYYAVTALLISNGLNATTHAGVRTMLGLKFIKTGILELDHGKFFNEIFEIRHSNDYDDFIFCDEDTYKNFRPKADSLIARIRELV